MGKKGKKKVPGRFAKRGQPAVPAPNPFETLYSRKKFDVMGKERKGAVKKTSLQSRSQAVTKVYFEWLAKPSGS